MNFDNIIQNYVCEALELNKYNKSCHIAILLDKRNRVVSHGYNQMDRQCFRGKKITSLHAEVDCMRKIRPISEISRRNYSLLVIKISRYDHTYTNSKPCDCCTKFIKGVGLNYVYCSNENGTIEKIKLDSSYVPEKIAYPVKF